MTISMKPSPSMQSTEPPCSAMDPKSPARYKLKSLTHTARCFLIGRCEKEVNCFISFTTRLRLKCHRRADSLFAPLPAVWVKWLTPAPTVAQCLHRLPDLTSLLRKWKSQSKFLGHLQQNDQISGVSPNKNLLSEVTQVIGLTFIAWNGNTRLASLVVWF